MKHTIWAVLNFVELTPVFASELDTGDVIRICKLCQLMQTCCRGITDISFEFLHNMPFELGLMVGLGIQATPFILIDKRTLAEGSRDKKFDLQLSNLKGAEVIVHENDPENLIRALLSRINGEFKNISIEQGKMKVYVQKILTVVHLVTRKFRSRRISYEEIEAAIGKLPRLREI